MPPSRPPLTQPASVETSPPYVDAASVQCLPAPPPYRFEGVTVLAVPLLADIAALSKLCDQRLNVTGDPDLQYRPIAGLVYLEVLQYDRMSSLDEPWSRLGATGQWELFLAMPVARKLGPLQWDVGIFCPYLWVDNSLSMLAGRECLGYPKFQGAFDAPNGPGNYPARLSALLFATPGACATVEPLIEVESIGSLPAMPQTEISLPFGPIDGLFGQGGPAELVADVADELREALGQQAPSLRYAAVQLKQFRDAADSRRACYQALTRSEITITSLREPRLLPPATVRFHRYQELDLAKWLGIRLIDDVAPSLSPFALSCDFDLTDTTNLWSTAG